MPRHDYNPADRRQVPLEIEDPTGKLVHTRGVVRLRKVDSLGSWSPSGTYGFGEILLETWRPKAMTGLLGFWASVVEDQTNGDLALFRLSVDAGASQLFWDGAVWRAPVSATEWNTEAQIDIGIVDLPFVDALSVILRLESGDGSSTPVFRAFYVFYEVRYDPTEDLLRSIHQKILDEVFVNADYVTEHAVPDDQLTVEDPIYTVDGPVQVFNRTNDPNLTTDLFVSRVENQLVLSSPQVGELLVIYRGRLSPDRVHVASDADFVQYQELPAVVIQNVSESRVHGDLEPAFEEQLRSIGTVRMRANPKLQHYSFQLVCSGQDARKDKKLADAVRRAFDQREYVRSLALDEEFPLVGLESVAQTNQTQDQVFNRAVAATVSVLEWEPAFRDVPMVSTVIQGVRPLFGGAPGDLETVE